MESSSLMYNSYNPYGDFQSDIGNIIETEKKINTDNIKKYNKEKEKLIPTKVIKDNKGIDRTTLDLDHISERITFTVNEVFSDISKQDYLNLFSKSKWTGYGYIFIIIYLCYFFSKL